MTGAWSDEAVARLKYLWSEGYPASVIGDELGKTRNAVIGRVHRLNLSNMLGPRAVAPARKTKERQKRVDEYQKIWRAKRKAAGIPQKQYRRARVTKPIDTTPLVEPKPLMVAITDLHDGICKWPIGEPALPGFGYCGHAKQDDAPIRFPYCRYHGRIAYQPRDRRTERAANWMVRSVVAR